MQKTNTILPTFMFLITFALNVFSQNLDEGLRDLTDQISLGMSEAQKQKIAVIEFSDLDGKITELGKYLSEELITRLFITKKFSVIERQLLNKVINEHKLNMTGLIDETTAKEIGKILGVEAICSGTITDLVNSVKINARLISTETGTLFSVASANIQKDEVIRSLMSKVKNDDQDQAIPQKGEITKSGQYFYYEDFSDVPEGMMPGGWIDGEKLIVKSENNQKFLTNFEWLASHLFIIDDIQFPTNFELEYMFKFGSDASSTQQLCSIGDVKLRIDVYGWYQMNETRFEKKQDFRNRIVKVILRKLGPIFKLFINGEEMIMARYPEFQAPRAITFEFQNMNGFRLYSISLKEI